jgi:hypothetical protein
MTEDQALASQISTDEKAEIAYNAYASAVGKVVHSWNYLQEYLGHLFSVVTGLPPVTAFAIWYSTDNDRAQRNMLQAVVLSNDLSKWNPRFPKATSDTLWLINRADALADQRNDAIHTPCDPVIDDAGRFDVTALTTAFFYGHPRAKKLIDRDILQEFDWCARSANILANFAQKVAIVLNEYRNDARRRYAWPDRPPLPDRRPKNVLQAQRRQPRIK